MTPMLNDETALDALRELANIGAGNAVTSLTRLLGGGRVMLAVPEVVSGERARELSGLDGDGLMVSIAVEGVFSCGFCTLFADESARQLAGALIHRDVDMLGAYEQSAIVETVNIVSCSFLGALASMTHGVLIPHAPQAHRGALGELVERAVGEENVVVLSSSFADERGYGGRILVVLDPAAAARMLESVGVPVAAATTA